MTISCLKLAVSTLWRIKVTRASWSNSSILPYSHDTTFTMGTLYLCFAQEVSLLQLLHILFPGTKHHTLRYQERNQDLLPLLLKSEWSVPFECKWQWLCVLLTFPSDFFRIKKSLVTVLSQYVWSKYNFMRGAIHFIFCTGLSKSALALWNSC